MGFDVHTAYGASEKQNKKNQFMKISDLVNLYFDGMNWTFIIHVKFGQILCSSQNVQTLQCLPNYTSIFTGNHGM